MDIGEVYDDNHEYIKGLDESHRSLAFSLVHVSIFIVCVGSGDDDDDIGSRLYTRESHVIKTNIQQCRG